MLSSDELLTQAMQMLAEQPNCLFVGQGVVYGGVATSKHLERVLAQQLIEFPVAEELQLGYCTGLALMGFLPVCIFPRMDFMLRAMDQLVNHLDKVDQLSQGQWTPKVIIRTRVGSKVPLDAGPQHTQDHCEAFERMLTNITVLKIERAEDVLPVYRLALHVRRSVIVVEALQC